MAKTRLTRLVKAPIIVQERDEGWPIPDQFVGVEIEFENFSRRQLTALEQETPCFWEIRDDGSLRNGAEAVLTQATMGRQLTAALDQFYNRITQFDTGPRTSIHVHLNMRQDYDSLESLRNLVILYFMYEDAFFRIADENRKWCSYCNPFEDNAPSPLLALFRAQSLDHLIDSINNTAHNTNRYYGLNLYSLARYGTLEFRHFPCVKQKELVVSWIRLLMELKKAATLMAERELSVFDVIPNEASCAKLLEYMPEFGARLRELCPDHDAYRRLGMVAAYRAGTPTDYPRMGNKNKIFQKFLASKGFNTNEPKKKKGLNYYVSAEVAQTGRLEAQEWLNMVDEIAATRPHEPEEDMFQPEAAPQEEARVRRPFEIATPALDRLNRLRREAGMDPIQPAPPRPIRPLARR